MRGHGRSLCPTGWGTLHLGACSSPTWRSTSMPSTASRCPNPGATGLRQHRVMAPSSCGAAARRAYTSIRSASLGLFWHVHVPGTSELTSALFTFTFSTTLLSRRSYTLAWLQWCLAVLGGGVAVIQTSMDRLPSANSVTSSGFGSGGAWLFTPLCALHVHTQHGSAAGSCLCVC